MTVSLSAVQKASFWSEWICLDCGYSNPEQESPENVCDKCGGEAFPADLLTRAIGRIDFETDNDGEQL